MEKWSGGGMEKWSGGGTRDACGGLPKKSVLERGIAVRNGDQFYSRRVPAEVRLVSHGQVIPLFGLPSGLSRRSHNWSATLTP